MDKGLSKPAAKTIDPSKILFGFGFLSLFILAFHVPERITALLFLCFFLVITAFNPINGTTFIVLSIPFFLGATHKPFFYLFEVLVYGYLAIGFIHLWKRKNSIEVPFKPLILLLTLSYLFSLPINAKEYYYEFWATPLKDIWFQWFTGHEKFTFFHLRTLSNALIGILLFILTFNLFSKREFKEVERNVRDLLWMAVVICLIGFLFLFRLIPSQPKTFLSLSLAGIHQDALSAFAFNRQYLAQYLLIVFPLPFYFLFLNRKKVVSFLFYLGVLVLLLTALSASMQRSAYLILFLETLLLIFFYIQAVSINQKKSLGLILIPFLILGIMVLMDFFFLEKRFFLRVLSLGFSDPDQRRVHLWDTAWNMFASSPLLGVGLGKYYEFFPEFFRDSSLSWKTFGFVRGEPHSFYLQTLAEQGAIGLLLIMGLLFTIITKMGRTIKAEPSLEKKVLLGVLIISLLTWFGLGFFHNVSYVRSLGVLLWILFGWSVSLIEPSERSFKKKTLTKGFWVGFLVITAALGYQVKLISQRPLSPLFATGVYDQEILPNKEKVCWTKKRAVVNTKMQNGAVIIDLSAPLPGIKQHEQRIRLWAGDRFREIILNDDQWHQISLPMDKNSTGWIPLKIETGYTFNPRKAKLTRDDRDLGVMFRREDKGS